MDEALEWILGILFTILFYVVPWLSKKLKEREEPTPTELEEDWLTEEDEDVWGEIEDLPAPFHGQEDRLADLGLEIEVQDQIQHRLDREEKIRAAIDAGATTEDEVVAQAYDDTPEAAWPIAKHQLKAHLARLGVTLES